MSWQIAELRVDLGETGIILQGHAYTGLGRALCEVEAARLSGLPVEENQIEVS